jgi:hypothetical protein
MPKHVTPDLTSASTGVFTGAGVTTQVAESQHQQIYNGIAMADGSGTPLVDGVHPFAHVLDIKATARPKAKHRSSSRR